MLERATSQTKDLTLEVLVSTSEHCCCAFGNVVLTRSLRAPDALYLRDWVNAILRHGRTQPQGLGIVIFIDAEAQPPNEAERGLIKDGFIRVRPVVRGAVQVIEGQGFMAAAMRGALTVTSLASGIGYPIKVTGDVGQAATLLSKMLLKSMDPRIAPRASAAPQTRFDGVCPASD